MNQPNAAVLKSEEGMFELSLLNAEASETKFDDLVVDAIGRGIPAELITRLKEIWDAARVIAGEVVAVGRIIVGRIIEFVKQNPKLTLGLALGAAVAALMGGHSADRPLAAAAFRLGGDALRRRCRRCDAAWRLLGVAFHGRHRTGQQVLRTAGGDLQVCHELLGRSLSRTRR